MLHKTLLQNYIICACLAQFKCYHKKLKSASYKTKKFNLNRKSFHVKTFRSLLAVRSRCNNIVVNYECNISKKK